MSYKFNPFTGTLDIAGSGGGGTPGGSDTQVQFNDAGSFGGDAGFTYNKTSDILTLGGGASAAELRFLEPSGSGSNYTALKAVAQGANITYSLPATVGGSNTFLNDAAGNGVLSWSNVPAATTPSGGDYSIQVNGTGSFFGDANFLYNYNDVLFGISHTGNAPDAQGFFDDVGGGSGLLTRINYNDSTNFYSFWNNDSGAKYLFAGKVLGKFRIGEETPGDTSAPLSVVDNGTSAEVRLGFFEEKINTSRSEFTIANSGDGSWPNNFISIMNNGSAYPNTYYTDSDAGTSIFLLQGGNAIKMSFVTYSSSSPINFWVGAGNKVMELNSSNLVDATTGFSVGAAAGATGSANATNTLTIVGGIITNIA